MPEPEFAELNAYRLERDWTWPELAADMERHRVGVSPRTLHYVCKRMPADGHALDRTLHKIRKYLVIARASLKRSEARRSRRDRGESREAVS
jgi:hypothetical protein